MIADRPAAAYAMPMTDALALAQALIRSDSVTPARGSVFDVLEAALMPLGFTVDRFTVGEEPDGPVENLLATRGGTGTHLAFAGHVDVVPAGDGWQGSPFSGEVRDGLLFGRGAVDMKGAVAAFVAAIPADPTIPLSLIITGDEEGPAIYGTRALIDRMAELGVAPDLCLVGEPTSAHRLGDMMKIGRRGSVNIWITVPGRQGHVAYPHLADNPITPLVAMLARSRGDARHRQCLVPAVQYRDHRPACRQSGDQRHSGRGAGAAVDPLQRRTERRSTGRTDHRHRAGPRPRRAGDGPYLGRGVPDPARPFSAMIADAIRAETGIEPELSTTGGTSDARFLSKLCPTVEFGLLNATMHKVDEAVAVEDLYALTRIYAGVIARAGA